MCVREREITWVLGYRLNWTLIFEWYFGKLCAVKNGYWQEDNVMTL